MKFYSVEIQGEAPVFQTVLVWANSETEAKQKAEEGDYLEAEAIETNDWECCMACEITEVDRSEVPTDYIRQAETDAEAAAPAQEPQET